MALQTNDRFFVCLIGKNPKLEKRYGVLAVIPGTKPPMFRLLTKNEDADRCAATAAMLNSAPGRTAVACDVSDELFPKKEPTRN